MKKLASFITSLALSVGLLVSVSTSASAVGDPIISPTSVATNNSTTRFTISNVALGLDYTSSSPVCSIKSTGRLVSFGEADVNTNLTITAFANTDIARVEGTIPASATETEVAVSGSFTVVCGTNETLVEFSVPGLFAYVKRPTITSVLPVGGLAGDTVTITGTNFTETSTVKFGSTSATVTDLNEAGTVLTVTVPEGNGAKSVDVLNSNDVKASRSNAFTYTAINTIAAKIGATSPGSFTISNLSLYAPGCTVVAASRAVSIGGEEAELTGGTTSSPNQVFSIVGKIPPSEVAASELAITVEYTTDCTDPADENTYNYDLDETFGYFAAPDIRSISPRAGTAGTVVTITGDNIEELSAVTFGTREAQIVEDSYDTDEDGYDTWDVIAPTGIGVVSVTVTANALTDTLQNAFTYANLSISSLTPALGVANATTAQQTTITGSGFSAGVQVYFGTKLATNVNVVSSTSLTVTVPTGAAGLVDVSVVSNTDTFTADDVYRYVDTPVITSFTATSGPIQGGSEVTIKGEEFFGTLTVKFGTQTASSVTQSKTDGTELKVLLPAKATADNAKVKVSVTNIAGTATSTGDFEYKTPSITTVSPAVGPAVGGNVVTITGVALSKATEVSFKDTKILAKDFLSASDTEIKVTAPAGTGTVTVSVKIGTTSYDKANAYTYVTAPVVSEVTPAIGLLAGGTEVTINGSNLTGVTKVAFGSQEVLSKDFVSASATKIVVKSPAGAVGKVDIVVSGPGGVTTIAKAFEYVAKICTPVADLGSIRFAKETSKLTAAARAALTQIAANAIASGCENVTLTAYKFKGKTALQKQMSKLANDRVAKVQLFLNRIFTTAAIAVTFERVTLSNQKTAFKSFDQFKVNRVIRFGVK